MATENNEFKLSGPKDIERYFRSAVTLSCCLSPEISAVNMEIRWFKETDCVCVYKNGQVTVGRGYEGRASLFTQELDRGNVSLQLRHCKWPDEGHYLCQVTDVDKTEEMTLIMGYFIMEEEEEEDVWVRQRDRKWTEDERMKMEKSALLTELEDKVKQLEDCKGVIEYKDTELRNQEKTIEEKEALLQNTNTTLEEMTKKLQEQDQQLKLKDTEIQDTQMQVEEMAKIFGEKDKELKESLEMNVKTLCERDAALMERNEKLENTNEQIKEKISQLENMNKLLSEKDAQLKKTEKELENTKCQLETLGQELQDKKRQLQEMVIALGRQKSELAETKQELEEKESLLTERETQLMELQEKDRLLKENTDKLQEKTDAESSAPIRRRKRKDLLPPIMSGESSSPHSPVSVPVAELRLVLLGRTGSGKSAAGNTILDREERNQAATSTVTSTSTPQGEVAGRKVSVVDTPDWFCPGLSLEKLRQDVGLCVRLSAPGPHAFLLVIPVKQPTGQERWMLEKMEMMFGERCWRNTMIIFSVTDELQKKNIDEFIQSGDQEVQRLVEKCGNRFYCLNIKESGDGSQVSELLEKIEKMMEGSREKYYSSEIYLETESQIRAIETKIMKEREEKRMREEMEMKEKIEKEVQDSLRKIEGVIQEHEGDIRQLNDRTTELERNLKEEKDDEVKRELESDLKREVDRRTETEEKVNKLKEERERERREMEERHQKEMKKIREEYEGEVRMETERNLMKIILPELQRELLASKTKMQEEFSRQMEEKHKELETIKQKLSELVSDQVYQTTVTSLYQV